MTRTTSQTGPGSCDQESPGLWFGRSGRSGRWWAWALVVVAVCGPAMVVDLGRRDVGRVMENISLLSSQETWLRVRGRVQTAHDRPAAWLIPTAYGRPRLNKPPLVVWWCLLAWSDLDEATAPAEQLVGRARLVSVAMGLVMLGSIFAMGWMVEGHRTAVVSALVAGTTWFFMRQARTASYDIHMAAWCTAAVAWGLWACRPFAGQVGGGRYVVGWLAAGVAMGLGVLSKGMLAVPLVVLPLGAAVVLSPQRRAANVKGLGLMLLAGLVVAGPWFIYGMLRYPQMLDRLLHEYQASRKQSQPVWYYVGLLGLIFPWTYWFVGTWFFPFVHYRGGARWRVLWPGLWWVVVMVMFSLPAAKQQRYILPALAPVGLMVGMLVAWMDRQSRQGRPDRQAGRLYVPYWLTLGGLSVVLGPFWSGYDWLAGRGWVEQGRVARLPWAVGVGLSVVLAGLVVWGWRLNRRDRVFAAALVGAVWTGLVLVAHQHTYDAAPRAEHRFVQAAAEVRAVVGGEPLYHLGLSGQEQRRFEDFEEFHFYCRRLIPTVGDVRRLPEAGSCFVLAPDGSAEGAVLAGAGWQAVKRVVIDERDVYRLWRRR